MPVVVKCEDTWSRYFLDTGGKWDKFYVGSVSNIFSHFRVIPVEVGDICVIVYWYKALIYRFEGICISLRKYALQFPQASICVRNVVYGIGIELVAMYYANRIYYIKILDYKRKQATYIKSKLYYLRHKLNRASRVK